MFGKKQEIIPAGSRAPVTHFTMHPNNGLVYFAHGDAPLYRSGDRIKTYDLNNGEVKTYIDRPGGAANPTLSKDGKFLAYIHRDDRETVLVIRNIQTNQEIEVSFKNASKNYTYDVSKIQSSLLLI